MLGVELFMTAYNILTHQQYFRKVLLCSISGRLIVHVTASIQPTMILGE